MRLPFIFAILFLCFSAGACHPQKSDPYVWDFGKVKEGEVLKHGFTFRNEGKSVLTIKEINTSCGCTLSEVKKKTLQPGETTTIDVQFKSKGYSGLTQQFVYVHTDALDPSTSSFDKLRTRPERSRRPSLRVNGERSRTIDNPVLRYIIKADVIK